MLLTLSLSLSLCLTLSHTHSLAPSHTRTHTHILFLLCIRSLCNLLEGSLRITCLVPRQNKNRLARFCKASQIVSVYSNGQAFWLHLPHWLQCIAVPPSLISSIHCFAFFTLGYDLHPSLTFSLSLFLSLFALSPPPMHTMSPSQCLLSGFPLLFLLALSR